MDLQEAQRLMNLGFKFIWLHPQDILQSAQDLGIKISYEDADRILDRIIGNWSLTMGIDKNLIELNIKLFLKEEYGNDTDESGPVTR